MNWMDSILQLELSYSMDFKRIRKKHYSGSCTEYNYNCLEDIGSGSHRNGRATSLT